jgi:choline dehydrogenase-like flavoprotein
MAKVMKSVDAVMVGMGWSGSIMARELTKAGLTVVGLERGADKSPQDDFALPRIRDELKYWGRQELMLDTSIETHTLRNTPSELALPMRKWDIPPVGDGLGGAGAHWNGVTWRFLPSEFVLRSHLTARYGASAIPEDMTIQDWGITYEDLEPHYDHFERLCGTSGKAGNLRGQKIDGGNPGIARAANARIVGNPQPRRGNFGAGNGGAAHHTGGAIMGTDPATSAVNRYLQNWDASNLFVMGGAAFPQNAGHNPTGTIGALTYWSAKAITTQYLKSPGPLVHA